MHGVVFTHIFEHQAKKAGLREEELMEIASWLAENPLAGDLMVGTGGARKVRFSREGKGKSGGYRTIHYFGGDDLPIFLLALVDKGRRGNLSMAERNTLVITLGKIGKAYREGAAARARLQRGLS
jgi:hypothetical protein